MNTTVNIFETKIEDYYRQTFESNSPLLVDVPRESTDYVAIEELFREYRGSSRVDDITTVQKVCNKKTYEEFWKEVEEFKLCKPDAKVYHLLHGTPTKKNVNGIARNNLKKERINLQDYNRNTPYYCGDGFYFTQSVPYALGHPSITNRPRSEQYLFLFDVLVGDVHDTPAHTPRGDIPPLLPQWRDCELLQQYGPEVFKPSRIKLPLPMRYDTTRPATGFDSFAKFHEGEFYPTHLITLRNPSVTY